MVKKMKGWREDAPQGRKPTAPDGCEVEYDFAKSCYRTNERKPRYWTGSKQLGGQGWAAQPLTKKKSAERKEFLREKRQNSKMGIEKKPQKKGRKPSADGCEVEYDFEMECYKTNERKPRYWTGSKQLGGSGWQTAPPH